MADEIRLGVIGACGRGGSFKSVIEALPGVRVSTICDTNANRLEETRAFFGAETAFTHHEEMLEEARPDAVIVGTPMPYHCDQSVAALEAGVHVLCEVPATVSVDECRRLVRAAAASSAIYAMAENYIFARPIMLVTELTRLGLFGKPYYGQGEYLHELKQLNEDTPWRRRWQTGINGNTYITHSLGPLLQWMPGDRVTAVCCAGTGRHHADPRGDVYEQEASVTTLCRMRSGGLSVIRLDMLSDRPHGMNCYQLQGTDGAFESSRAPGEPDRVWLRALGHDANRWTPLANLESEFLPACRREADAVATRAGHGGGDYFEIADFVAAVRGEKRPTIGIHEGMDLTLPGLASQESIRTEPATWVEVPDSRDWV